MAFDVDDFDKIFFGDVIEAAAADAGVGKGIEPTWVIVPKR